MNAFELGTDGPRLIVAAVDGTVTSLRAGAYAAGLARRQGAELVIVTVTTTSSLGGLSADAATVLAETARAQASELQDEAARALERLEMQGRFVQVHGDPYTEIVRLADDLRADAVVVGASMQAGHRFVGSIAARLVKSGTWPVTVVP